MHEKCQIQTCQQSCCNLYGYCPIKSTDPKIENCYYYYATSTFTITNNVGPFVAIILVSVAVFILIVLLLRKLWAFCKKKYFTYTPNAQKAQTEQNIGGSKGVKSNLNEFRQGDTNQRISKQHEIVLNMKNEQQNEQREVLPETKSMKTHELAEISITPTPNIQNEHNQITMQNILENPPDFYFIE